MRIAPVLPHVLRIEDRGVEPGHQHQAPILQERQGRFIEILVVVPLQGGNQSPRLAAVIAPVNGAMKGPGKAVGTVAGGEDPAVGKLQEPCVGTLVISVRDFQPFRFGPGVPVVLRIDDADACVDGEVAFRGAVQPIPGGLLVDENKDAAALKNRHPHRAPIPLAVRDDPGPRPGLSLVGRPHGEGPPPLGRFNVGPQPAFFPCLHRVVRCNKGRGHRHVPVAGMEHHQPVAVGKNRAVLAQAHRPAEPGEWIGRIGVPTHYRPSMFPRRHPVPPSDQRLQADLLQPVGRVLRPVRHLGHHHDELLEMELLAQWNGCPKDSLGKDLFHGVGS